MFTLQGVRYSLSGLLAVWGLVVCSGFVLLQGYVTRPGDAGSPPVRWPEDNPFRRDGHRSTLLIFLHPLCPCSSASVEELGYVLSQCGERVSAHAVLLVPSHRPEEWRRSPIEQELAASSDVHIWVDKGGATARRFRVETSGHVVLYNSRGRLSYSGGITAARGHRGDNYGRAAVIDRILGAERYEPASPVFGCPLTAAALPSGEEQR